MSISSFASNLGATAKGVVKLIVNHRHKSIRRSVNGGRIVVMGNGPSLRTTIDNNLPVLQQSDTMAVNFAALADVFFDIRPRWYIMADPHFFSGADTANLIKLREALSCVSWPMCLLIPAGADASKVTVNPNIQVVTFANVGIEGFNWFTDYVYSHRMGMPRPRNVLIPAIMCAIWLGYRQIDIVGADHSWMQTLGVDDQNRIISVQPHFYKDDKTEQSRVNTEYAGYHLHDIVYSFYVAFKSYHDIARFAAAHGVSIFNATPSSFIDAFTRRPLS